MYMTTPDDAYMTSTIKTFFMTLLCFIGKIMKSESNDICNIRGNLEYTNKADHIDLN